MPELPEVEYAAQRLRAAVEGKTLADVVLHHEALRRSLGSEDVRLLRGVRVVGIDRRGKHQLIRLADGATLHAHFRMSGDWAVVATGAPAATRHVRAELRFTDGSRVLLVDPRALATLRRVPPGCEALPALGPEATDPAFDVDTLGAALRGRRTAIKVALLDQRVVAGLGNIYAVEALWRARIDPRVRASSLGPRRRMRLVEGIRAVLRAALDAPGRYGDEDATAVAVYGREGSPCVRCGAPVRRIVQGGRSTYFCPRCQRA